MELKERFTEIFNKNEWSSQESRSGSGSELRSTVVLRQELAYMFAKYQITSMLDIPCGDFNWMQYTDLTGIAYQGADIVESVVESNKLAHPEYPFSVLDITTDVLPKVDLVFVRDLLGHLSDKNIFKALRNIKASGSKYLIVTSFTRGVQNPNIVDGNWKPINLMIPPFSLKPIYLINEKCEEGFPYYNDKCMIMFDLAELQCADLTLPEPELEPVKSNKKVKFIIPFPDVPYYLWQVLVQINNFRKLGYEADTHYLASYSGTLSPILRSFIDSSNIKSTFHTYLDTREDKTYTASTKPWCMAQYFKEYPEEKENVYVYLDPDVIFLKPIDWTKFLGDDIWYESNTSSYLNSTYIKSKGVELFQEMCDIVGISPELVIANDKNAGGAQYVTKNNTYEFWNEVEKTSVPLYKHMIATKDKYRPEGDPYSIQAWTAEMWTTDWILWKNGVTTKTVPELEFHWADHLVKDIRYSIYHNAGVSGDSAQHFSKTLYQSSPFNKELKGETSSLSYKYIVEIKQTELNFPELIWT